MYMDGIWNDINESHHMDKSMFMNFIPQMKL
jgi:hypothetical protein